jgi:hypothetical protein
MIKVQETPAQPNGLQPITSSRNRGRKMVLILVIAIVILIYLLPVFTYHAEHFLMKVREKMNCLCLHQTFTNY